LQSLKIQAVNCGVVDQQRAFHKLATVIAGENAFAPKLKMHALEAFAVYDALFRRISRTHSLPPVVRCLLGSGCAADAMGGMAVVTAAWGTPAAVMAQVRVRA
jgi:hypothetical protein